VCIIPHSGESAHRTFSLWRTDSIRPLLKLMLSMLVGLHYTDTNVLDIYYWPVC